MSPVTFGELIGTKTNRAPENPRILARCQALESPTVPQSSAIPQTEIASYPREWRDGAASGKYSHIPTYMGWCRGKQPELAGLSIPAERPLSPVPGPSTRTEPIEQPVFEGPRWPGRVWQPRQQPENVYGDDPFIDCLTESQ